MFLRFDICDIDRIRLFSILQITCDILTVNYFVVIIHAGCYYIYSTGYLTWLFTSVLLVVVPLRFKMGGWRNFLPGVSSYEILLTALDLNWTLSFLLLYHSSNTATL